MAPERYAVLPRAPIEGDPATRRAVAACLCLLILLSVICRLVAGIALEGRRCAIAVNFQGFSVSQSPSWPSPASRRAVALLGRAWTLPATTQAPRPPSEATPIRGKRLAAGPMPVHA